MKIFAWTLALTLVAASLFAGGEPDLRALWLRGEWTRAEARLERNAAIARRTDDRAAELAALRDRALLLLDRSSYTKHDPVSVREAVARFHEAAMRSDDSVLRSDAIHAMGRYRYWQMFSGEGEWSAVAELFKQALALREASGEPGRLADSHFYLGLVHQMQGQAAEARAEFERGLTYSGADPLLQSFLERHLGALDEDAGNHDLAHRRYTASVELRRRSGATLLVPFALNLLASHEESFLKNAARATQLYRESAGIARQSRSTRALAAAEGELARLAESRGDLRAARRHAARALEAANAHGDPELVREARERQEQLRSGKRN